MKKSFFTLFMSMGLVAGAYAQDQQNEEVPAATEENTEEASVSAKSDAINHWSLAVKGGINFGHMDKDEINFEIGGMVERTFNPRWGMGVEYMFLKDDHDNLSGFEGCRNNITIFGSINMSNIIAPYRSKGWQRLNWFVRGGLGATIYSYSFEDFDETYPELLAVASTDLEVNVCKYIAVFLEAQYSRNKKNIDGYDEYKYPFKHNKWAANIGVRVNFGGERNIRNIAWADYIPGVEVPDFSSIFDAQKAEMDAKAAEQQKAIDSQNDQIKKLQSQIKFTQDSLDRHILATKPKVAYVPTAEEHDIIKKALSNLEFETGSAVIKETSFTYLDGLASLLKKHPEWSVKLAGHTDNVGNAAKNLQLSKDRAASVKKYMTDKGADGANIESEGYGSTKPIASNNTAAGKAKNRRVEVELSVVK